MKFNIFFLVGLSACMSLHVVAKTPADSIVYVSPAGDNSAAGTLDNPFKTIQKALDATLNSAVNTILLKGGVYELQSPIIIRPEHTAHKNSLKISGYGKDKVIVSGGKEIGGWKKQKNGLWVTDVEGVKEGKLHFRQLFVNDEWRQRAKTPNEGFYHVKSHDSILTRFVYENGDFDAKWKNLQDVEVNLYHYWNDTHLPVSSVDAKTNTVTFQFKSPRPFQSSLKTTDGAIYTIENAFEALDAPGEWYLDKHTGKCYYYPFPNEKTGEVKFTIPVSAQLIRLEGDLVNQQLVENVSIENIEFRYTNFELPVGNANYRQASFSLPASVYFVGVQNSSLSHCRFKNLGNWAVELDNGCTGNTFKQNEIVNVAAGGFKANGANFDEHYFLRTFNNQFLYNEVHDYGKVYSSAVGILLMRTSGNLVSHNSIHHGYYTAISVGWDWGYHRSVSRDNVIEFNKIHDIGQGLISDMGAIYTLGVSPGTILRNNLIHDLDAHDYGGYGIYHDEGSTHILDENNIVYNIKNGVFDIHYSKEIMVQNNIFAFGKESQVRRYQIEPHQSVYFERNIVYWDQGDLFGGKWHDLPYTFYFSPKQNKGGTKTVNETFSMDYNLYFNPDKKVDAVSFNGNTWQQWHALGKDVHSVYADPLFEDAKNYNFTLKENSPAFKMGFKQIDMKHVGLDGKKTGPDN